MLRHLVIPVTILLALFAAWRDELIGGILLIVLGGLFFWWIGWHGWGVALVLQAPLLLIGMLLIDTVKLTRNRREAREP